MTIFKSKLPSGEWLYHVRHVLVMSWRVVLRDADDEFVAQSPIVMVSEKMLDWAYEDRREDLVAWGERKWKPSEEGYRFPIPFDAASSGGEKHQPDQ